MKLILKTMPPAVNATYKRGSNSFYKSSEAKDAQEAIQWEMRSQYRGRPIKKPVSLSITIYEGDMRRHDIDSRLKSLLDCGTGLLYEDDNQIQEMFVAKHLDKKSPRVELWITTLDD